MQPDTILLDPFYEVIASLYFSSFDAYRELLYSIYNSKSHKSAPKVVTILC